MYSLLQIFIIWLFVKKDTKILILSSLLTIYLVIYLLIDVVSSNGFNLAALYHLKTNVTGMSFSGYITSFISIISLSIIIIFLSIYISKIIKIKISTKNFVFIFFSLFFLSLPTFDIINLLYNLNSFKKLEKFDSIKVENYENLIIKKKNIVFISVESLNYSLWEKFKKKNIKLTSTSFNNIREIDGTNWSIAGLTALNCSLPLNPSIINEKIPHIYPRQTCLTDILEKSKYNNFVIQGTDGRFANQESLYLSHSVQKKNFIDKRKIKNKTFSSWGYHDEVLFEEAKKIISNNISSNTNEPFSIFINTFDSHAPNGYSSPKCMKKYSFVKIELEKAFRCVIDEIFDLIEFIQEKNIDETILVVHSDHLLMSKNSKLINKKNLEKNTFEIFFLNSDEINKKTKIINQKGTLLDIAPTVLDILTDNKTTKMGLGFSLINKKGIQIPERENAVYAYSNFLEEQQSLPKLNFVASNLNKKTLSTNFNKNLPVPFLYLSNKNKYIFPQSGIDGQIRSIDIYKLIKKINSPVDILFLNCKKIPTYKIPNGICALTKNNNKSLNVININKKIFLTDLSNNLQKSKYVVDKKLFQPYSTIKQFIGDILRTVFPPEKLKMAFNFYHFVIFKLTNSNSFLDDEINIEKIKKNNIAHAGGAIDDIFYTNSLEAIKKSLNNGLSMIELDLQLSSDGYIIAVHDWKSWSKSTGCSIDSIPSYKKFLSCKPYNRYTPVSYENINELMDEYQNLILITDKINSPEILKKQINNFERVYMEIFSEEKVFEALDLDIKVLVSETILYKYLLLKHLPHWVDKIDGVTISRHTLMRYPNIFKNLIENKKKVFVFSINDGHYRGKEAEVMSDLKGYITGIYVDYY